MSANAARSAWVRARLDRIHKIPIEQVLSRTGFDVRPDVTEVHQTFSCTLHGTDSRPSGRTYPGSRSWYCWGCALSRDAVATVREKMGLGFEEAIRWIEGAFALSPLPRPAAEEGVPEEQEEGEPAEDPLAALERAADQAASNRKIPLDLALACWEVADRARIDDRFREVAVRAIPQLRARVLEGT